jgi:hypothetical protein
MGASASCEESSLPSSLSLQQQATPIIAKSITMDSTAAVLTSALYPLFPKGLQPDHEQVIPGLGLSVPATNITFKRWKSKPMRDDLGGKPVVEYEGRPMFVELAVVQMAVRNGGGGWSAFWQEAYPICRQSGGPSYYADWREDAPRKDQITINSLDNIGSPYHQKLQASIARYNGNSFRGCWEVIAWNGEVQRTMYIKIMQSNRDANFRDNQIRWFSACLSAGLKRRENFLVVKWQFEDHHYCRREHEGELFPSESTSAHLGGHIHAAK